MGHRFRKDRSLEELALLEGGFRPGPSAGRSVPWKAPSSPSPARRIGMAGRHPLWEPVLRPRFPAGDTRQILSQV
jgi:hypothetical protein